MKTAPQHHILITGASSGLGRALAIEYAAPHIRLSLSGRNMDRLEETARECQKKGAVVEYRQIDVANRDDMRTWINARWKDFPIDLCIANAGISGGTGKNQDIFEPPDQRNRIFSANWEGVLNTVDPLLAPMAARGKGQIALMSSLAGFRGWPGSPSYSASKALVRIYGEAMRSALEDRGISVNVICPGFIRTPMTDVNSFKMPFLMSAEKAAKIMRKGLAKNKGRIAFPWPTAFIAWLTGALPDAFVHKLLKSAPAKPALPE